MSKVEKDHLVVVANIETGYKRHGDDEVTPERLAIIDYTGQGYSAMVEVDRGKTENDTYRYCFAILDRAELTELRDRLTTWLAATA